MYQRSPLCLLNTFTTGGKKGNIKLNVAAFGVLVSGCGVCKRMQPIFQQAATETKRKYVSLLTTEQNITAFLVQCLQTTRVSCDNVDCYFWQSVSSVLMVLFVLFPGKYRLSIMSLQC